MSTGQPKTPTAPGEVMPSVWVSLSPRDTLAVRDGRAFDAGADVTAVSALPGPSTVAGAVGASFRDGSGQVREPRAVRGPVVAVRDGSEGWQLFFPVPADMVEPESGGLARLQVTVPPGGVVMDWGHEQGDGVAHRGPGAWLTGDGAAATGWVSQQFLTAYLRAEGALSPGCWSPGGDLLARTSPPPWSTERRLGLARTEQGIAEPGFLYQAEHLRFQDGAALLAEVVDPPAAAPVRRPVPLGGERRYVDVDVAGTVDLPVHPADFPGGRVAVYLATPALFPDGWSWAPDGAELVTAAVTGPYPVAAASPRQGLWRTRVLRWAVPAGTVYFLRFSARPTGSAAETATRSPEEVALEWVRTWHARCLPGQVHDEQGADRLRTAGFGLALMGRW